MNIINEQLKIPLLSGHSVEDKRTELKQYFHNTWQTYESLFALINDDSAFYLRPEPLRHPLVFYYGHTATFYINKLILGKFIDKRINQKLEAICAVGVDEMSWDDLNSEHYDWPSIDEVRKYRNQVSELIDNIIDEMPLTLPIAQDSLAWIILMGCEHERIHVETSSVIMRMLPAKYLSPTTDVNNTWHACQQTGDAPLNQLLPVCGKQVKLGKTSEDNTYGWDNEYGEATVEVHNFQASKYLVSNQEFLAFIEAGGYHNSQYWSEEGQSWLSFTKAEMPRFWRKEGQRYFQRNLLETIPLPLDWPVEVNQLEANAFCRWKSEVSGNNIRLPSEPEWYCLRDKIPTDLPNWQQAPGNINLEFFASSCPVNTHQTDGFYDIIGNVWQWTESTIDGFNGFAVHPLYDDFSTPTFDGKHNLIKGGSWISTGNEAIRNSRYAFRRHFYQHAGFRYVQSESKVIPQVPNNHYETNADVCQQLESHYGKEHLNVAQYPLQIKEVVLRNIEKYQLKTDRCLDLGASVGRVSFELSGYFNHIDAVDFSARYIQHGVRLQTGASVRYITKNEGEICNFYEVSLSDLDLTTAGKNILFSQGDASNLKPIFRGYDLVLVQHVLERNYNPKLFLQDIQQRINQDGLLIIVSDYQFDQNIKDKQQWLGGKKVNGENVFGIDGINQLIEQHFEQVACENLTRVLQQANRSFLVSQPEITIWRKKG